MKQTFKETIKQDKKDFIKFLFFFSAIIVMIAVFFELLPWIISLKDEESRNQFQEYIYSKGVMGVVILFGIQVLQVIIAIIPGEPIEIVSGLLYGTGWGFVICEVGMLFGTIVIYYGVKILGASFITRLVGEGKLKKYKFLNDVKSLEVITFLLFFIPGTPKDLLTYFMPFTKIKPSVFFLIVAVARVPSIISSTFAGESISEGKWVQTVIIFLVIGATSILGIIFNEKITTKLSAQRDKLKNKPKK